MTINTVVDAIFDTPLNEPDLRRQLRCTLAKYSPDQPRDKHGRFASGGAMNRRIGQLSRTALRRTATEGGFTIRDVGRVGSKFTTPKEGYALSLWPDKTLLLDAKSMGRQEAKKALVSWIKENRKLIDTPNMHIGGWHDTDSGQVYIDLSVVYPKGQKAEAIAHAKKANQKAIWSLHDSEEIDTGGTGEDLHKALPSGAMGQRNYIPTSGMSDDELADAILDAMGFVDPQTEEGDEDGGEPPIAKAAYELAELADADPSLTWLVDSALDVTEMLKRSGSKLYQFKDSKQHSDGSAVGDHGPSIRWDRMYEALIREGHDKSSAAAISNAAANRYRIYGKAGKPGAKSDSEADRRRKISSSMKARASLRKALMAKADATPEADNAGPAVGDVHVNAPLALQPGHKFRNPGAGRRKRPTGEPPPASDPKRQALRQRAMGALLSQPESPMAYRQDDKVQKADEEPKELWEPTGTVHGSNGRWTPAMLEAWKQAHAGDEEEVEKWDPHQPRDKRGRWTNGGQVDRAAAAAAAADKLGGQALALGTTKVPEHWPETPGNRVAPAPIAKAAAEAWRALHPERRGSIPEADYNTHSVAPERTLKVADAYDALDHHEVTPAARKAWKTMAKEVGEQYDFLKKQGVKFEFVRDDPYPDFASMVKDLTDNQRVKVFTTKVQSEALGVKQYHPVLTDRQNDMFRAVHDVLGHAAIGRGFDFDGEDSAYYHHGSMFSQDALRALAVETRGQNSHYAKAQLAGKSPGESFDPYQRVGFLPDELLKRRRRRRRTSA